MTSQQASKHVSRQRNRVDVAELYLKGNSSFAMAEFYRLLRDSEFVTKVIEIHQSDRKGLDEYRETADPNAIILEIQDDSQWESLVKKHLADWLFRITDILTMQAKFASRGYPMSHAQLAALFEDAFFIDASEDLRLKDGRNEVWSAYALKRAINTALPEIQTRGAVTLANLARRINAKSKEILVGGTRARLSGKHLQKLLKKHDIDWIGIKTSYKKRPPCPNNAPDLPNRLDKLTYKNGKTVKASKCRRLLSTKWIHGHIPHLRAYQVAQYPYHRRNRPSRTRSA